MVVQWWNVTKYIYSSTVLRYKFEVYLSIYILCIILYFLLHYIC